MTKETNAVLTQGRHSPKFLWGIFRVRNAREAKQPKGYEEDPRQQPSGMTTYSNLSPLTRRYASPSPSRGEGYKACSPSPRAGEVARRADGGSCVSNTPLSRCAVLSPQEGQKTARGFTARSVIPVLRTAENAGYSGHSGFTLIELLVVILIIGILAAIALPQYQKAVEKSKAVQAIHLLKEVAQAQNLYYMEKGTYPTQFNQLDVNIPWTGKLPLLDINSADWRSNEDWTIGLNDTHPDYKNIFVQRKRGKYAGGSFGFYMQTSNKLVPLQQMLCMEHKKSLPTAGMYCGQLFHGIEIKGLTHNNYRWYTFMP